MIISESQSLYSDIDCCITELLKARTEHNSENEGKALFKMESLMVSTLQHLACIIEQPSLPSNLDEAAEEYADSMGLKGFDKVRTISDFKAGAEWMAGQGIYADAEVCKLAEHAWVTPIDEKQLRRDLYDNFVAGDEVIVQIRKKQ